MVNQDKHISFVLRVGTGSFAEGFPVRLQVLENSAIIDEIKLPNIPPKNDLPDHYERWRSTYNQLGNTRRIKPIDDQKTHGRLLQDCRDATSQFEAKCEGWFQQSELLRHSIKAEAQSRGASQIPVILDVNTGSHEQDTQLKKVPWHLWRLFEEDLPESEMVLNGGFSRSSHKLSNTVKVLAIFGSAEGGLQLDQDLAALEQLQSKGALVTTLKQPSREELHNHLWQKDPYEIIFFAGHSASDAGHRQGCIQIQDETPLPLKDLRQDLKHAIEQGLQLAIFNSCDGIGIGAYLKDLKVPAMIIMREPVADLVCRKFLCYFLDAFASGQPLHIAVRTTRKRLHWLESNDKGLPCPAATWLPIIIQNPNLPPLQWPTPSETNKMIETKFDFKLWIARGIVGLILLVAVFQIPKLFRADTNDGSPATTETPREAPAPRSLDERISQGERSLIPDEAALLPASLCAPEDHTNFNTLKAVGTDQMARQQYAKAADSFQAAFNLCPTPETLIFRNNAAIAAGDTEPFTLAVSVPISGASPSNALEMLRGMAQAQSEVNSSAAKINGKPLQLLVLDDEDDPQIAAEIANELVDNHPEVLGVIAHWTSDVSLAAAAVYEARQALAFVTPISTTNELTNFSPFVFRATINNLNGSRALADHMVNVWQDKKAAIFCVDGVTYSEEICAGFERSLKAQGGQVVERFNLGDPDLNALESLAAAKAQGAEVILLATNNDSVDRAVGLIEANQGEMKVLGDMANLYTLKTLQAESVEGMVMAIAWHPDGNVDETFVNASTTLWRGRVNYVTALAYGTAQAMIEAVGKAPTRAGVQAQLRDPDFAAPSPDNVPMTFGTTGDRPAPVQLIEVQKRSPSLSGTGADFVPIE